MENTIKFYDPRQKPFEIFGLFNPTDAQNGYRRLPENVAKSVSPGVYALHTHTAGGRIRFATNSTQITIKCKLKNEGLMPHTTPLLEYGFDLYLDKTFSYKYLGTFKFETAKCTEYEITLPCGFGMKQLTLNMPCYGGIDEIFVGLDEKAIVESHVPYRNNLPVVYYGSSITQGACASRPGITYQSYISRKFDTDYINLGFSGNAKGEKEIADYMASLEMSAFVSDYDHNAPSNEHLKATHYPLYETIRAKHPDIPYFMISRPNFDIKSEGCISRRDIIMESYLKARQNGDKHVYFIDGSLLFTSDVRGECTVDNTHPSDIGFYRMASVIGDVMGNVMFN